MTEKPTEAEMTPPTKESSQIAAVGHKDGYLFVTFKDWRDGSPSTYRYDPHPDHIAHDLHHAGILASESPGKYVNEHVKKKPYAYQKLS